MKKTVIFLGAGASKSDGAPLQRELFQSYFESCGKIHELQGSEERYREITDIVNDYFEKFFDFRFGEENSDKRLPRFEEVLGILDLAINRKEEYKESAHDLLTYREGLIFSMAQAIHYELDYKHADAKRKNHNQMVAKLAGEIQEGNVSFLSTNYDLLIDNALLEHGILPDYGFTLGAAGKNLIKIHGSLNWKYCPICKNIERFDEQRFHYEAYLETEHFRCTHCNSRAEYVIVPPTYYKDMSNIYLSNIWYNAELLLTGAEHIVFCGYSLPNADMHIKYMLKRAEINRQDNKPLTVTIINAPDGDEANPKEGMRFQRFFRTRDVRFEKNTSFEVFARDPMAFMKLE